MPVSDDFDNVSESHHQILSLRQCSGSWVNPLTPMVSLVILLTVCHTILMMLVLRVWYWINL